MTSAIYETDDAMTLTDVIETYKAKGWDFDLPIFVAGPDGQESFLFCLQASFWGLETDAQSCVLFRRAPGPQLEMTPPPGEE